MLRGGLSANEKEEKKVHRIITRIVRRFDYDLSKLIPQKNSLRIFGSKFKPFGECHQAFKKE